MPDSGQIKKFVSSPSSLEELQQTFKNMQFPGSERDGYVDGKWGVLTAAHIIFLQYKLFLIKYKIIGGDRVPYKGVTGEFDSFLKKYLVVYYDQNPNFESMGFEGLNSLPNDKLFTIDKAKVFYKKEIVRVPLQSRRDKADFMPDETGKPIRQEESVNQEFYKIGKKEILNGTLIENNLPVTVKIPRGSSSVLALESQGVLWAYTIFKAVQIYGIELKKLEAMGEISCYRPYDDPDIGQIAAYGDYLYKGGALTAKPGTSNHGWGIATDLNVDHYIWQQDNPITSLNTLSSEGKKAALRIDAAKTNRKGERTGKAGTNGEALQWLVNQYADHVSFPFQPHNEESWHWEIKFNHFWGYMNWPGKEW